MIIIIEINKSTNRLIIIYYVVMDEEPVERW